MRDLGAGLPAVRHRNATACALVQMPFGSKRLALMPVVTPFSTAHTVSYTHLCLIKSLPLIISRLTLRREPAPVVRGWGPLILFRLFLSCRNVEASLLQLVLDVAFIGFPPVSYTHL